MKDLRNLSNPFALAACLLVVCAIASFAMALTAVKTAGPIHAAMEKDTIGLLAAVLPEYDNNPAEDFTEIKFRDGSMGKLYIARKDGNIVGYATETQHPGYGGPVKGVTGFRPDGTILMVMIQAGHSETPGIGSRVTDRVYRRTIGDILHGRKPDGAIPPNPTLDSYAGKSAAQADQWTVRKTTSGTQSAGPGQIDFVSGATYSSTAVFELVKDAAHAVSDYLHLTTANSQEARP